MILEVENVAKVKNAKININGISVIAGYNSSGKSTISKSLYLSLSLCSGLDVKIKEQRQRSLIRTVEKWLIDNYKGLPTQERVKVKRASERVIVNFIINQYYLNNYIDYNNLYDFLMDNKDFDLEFTHQDIERLHSEINQIIEKPDSDYLEFVTSLSINNIFNSQISDFNSDTTCQISLKEKNNVNVFEISLNNDKIINTPNVTPLNIKEPIYIATKNLLDSLDSLEYYGSRFIGTSLSFDKDTLDLLRKDKDTDEFTLEEYNNNLHILSEVQGIFDLIGLGEVKKDKNNNLGYFENNKKIDFVNVASGLKPFIIIKRLLENYSINENSILILDEPEMNLHPDWQVKFAELLVLLQKQLNMKIIINSHSPYFIRALEVYSAKHKIADKCNYYFMDEQDQKHFIAKDVTDNTEYIYKTLYSPLEEL